MFQAACAKAQAGHSVRHYMTESAAQAQHGHHMALPVRDATIHDLDIHLIAPLYAPASST
jgi:hypothetical protein